MSLLLLSLLQQGRLSKVVIVGAALLFIAGVSLLVYFYRRYRRIEKEPEEDWDLSRRSLFVNVAPPARIANDGSAAAAVPTAPIPEITPVVPGGTSVLASEAPSQTSKPAASDAPPPSEAPAPPSAPIEVREAAPPVEPVREERMTQVLASPSLPESQEAPESKESKEPKEPKAPEPSLAKTESEHEHTAFDDEVWAGLEADELTSTLAQGAETMPLHAVTEQLPGARVDERSHREPFEAPRIERVLHREPFEPPAITPLTPREQAAVTRELRSSTPAGSQTTIEEAKETPARNTMIFGASPAKPDARPSSAEPVIAASGRIAEPSVAGVRSRKAPAGSILGLPAEASQGPLILGAPARTESDTGIGALTNYGKDLSPKAGWGGTIALIVVVALLGGAVLLYLFVPTVHSRVNSYIGRARGTDSQASTKPKAQIFPSFRQEGSKAKGAIDNISDEPLENLEVEISVQHDASPEVRRGAVAPNPLPPNTRGTFEFDYDAKKDTNGKILRLLSNGNEIKFRAPNQP
ncbi:MAG TPA: hypothetical protein VN937_26060 [Blastocatellia bacterium]|nr:hypothetical protein [Blastocatellia bacterium]